MNGICASLLGDSVSAYIIGAINRVDTPYLIVLIEQGSERRTSCRTHFSGMGRYNYPQFMTHNHFKS